MEASLIAHEHVVGEAALHKVFLLEDPKLSAFQKEVLEGQIRKMQHNRSPSSFRIKKISYTAYRFRHAKCYPKTALFAPCHKM